MDVAACSCMMAAFIKGHCLFIWVMAAVLTSHVDRLHRERERVTLQVQTAMREQIKQASSVMSTQGREARRATTRAEPNGEEWRRIKARKVEKLHFLF